MIDPQQQEQQEQQEFLNRLEQFRIELWTEIAEFAAQQRALRGAIAEAAQDPNKNMVTNKETETV